jgi:hypothetical protein
VFFNDWSYLTGHIFTSPYMWTEKFPIMSDEQPGHVSEKPSRSLVWSVGFWNYWAVYLWRNPYSDRKRSTIPSNAADVDGELSAWWCNSAHSMWINGFFDSHVSRTHHFTFWWPHGQPGLLSSAPDYSLRGQLKANVYENKILTLGSWKSVSQMKLQPLISFYCKEFTSTYRTPRRASIKCNLQKIKSTY